MYFRNIYAKKDPNAIGGSNHKHNDTDDGCVFRALPIMFAVTLDLRIFANNVSGTHSSVDQ